MNDDKQLGVYNLFLKNFPFLFDNIEERNVLFSAHVFSELRKKCLWELIHLGYPYPEIEFIFNEKTVGTVKRL